MSWLVLAFLGGVFSNVSSFFSRFILKDHDSDSTLYAWFFEAARFVVFFLAALFEFHIVLTFYSFLIFSLLGASEFVSIYFYMKMHKYSHLSISTILSRTRLIWVPPLAFLFAGEHLHSMTYVGILVLFCGLAVATAPHKLQFDRGQKYAYVAAFIIAINIVLLKLAQPLAPESVLIVFLTFPITFLYPLLIKNRNKRLGHFLTHNIPAKIAGGTASVLSIYFFTFALKTGSASLVNGVYQATMILSVLAGILILGEKEDVKRKLIGSAITLVGVLLLS